MKGDRLRKSLSNEYLISTAADFCAVGVNKNEDSISAFIIIVMGNFLNFVAA